MCRDKSAASASEPRPRSRSASSVIASSSSSGGFPTTDSGNHHHHFPAFATAGPLLRASTTSFASSSTSAGSLTSLRDSLPEPPVLYPFSELSAATNGFRADRLPSSSSAWRCQLRGKDAVVLRRPFRRNDRSAVPARLAALAKSHHNSLVHLLGASIDGGTDYIYLVHEYCPGAPLVDCLRNPRNPSFTLLASWSSRVQIAADIAHGLEYIHHHSSVTGGVHNRVNSSAIIVAQQDLRAKICHFGAADLAGEIPVVSVDCDADAVASGPKLRRAGSGRLRIEGKRGYMSPEVLSGGGVSCASDVYAFGIVLLELLSGDEPLRTRYDEDRGEVERVSLVETAARAIGAADEGSAAAAAEAEERRMRVRQWVDRRLKDSFPVEAAEKLMRVALRCVLADPAARPDMMWVAGMVSGIYLESKAWEASFRYPTEISVSIAVR